MPRTAFPKNPRQHFKATAIRLLHPRTQLATLSLLAVLQKSPALARVLNSIAPSIEPATRILQKLTLAATSFGAYHALSGATTAVYSTSSEPPFTFEIGSSVTIVFGVSKTENPAGSWSVTGDIPPGLTISGTDGAQLNSQSIFNNQYGQIAGTPTQAGIYTVFLKPWHKADAKGDTAEAFKIVLTIETTSLPLVAPHARIQNNPDSLVVTWSIQSGQSYHIQTSETPLDLDSWSTLTSPTTTEGSQQQATFSKDSLPQPLILRIATQRTSP